MSFTNKMLHIFHPALASLPPGRLGNATRGYWGTRERGLGYFWREGKRGGRVFLLFPEKCQRLVFVVGVTTASRESYVFPHACVYVCVYMYYYGVCMYLSIREQICSYVCACMVCTFEYVSEGIYVYVICLYAYTWMCAHVCLWVCTCSVHVWVCICMHIWLCVYVCAYVSLYVSTS